LHPSSLYSINHPARRNEKFHITNEWVVPYNPYLSKKYKAHINVECCGSVQAVKYINKYIYKGQDRTTLRISDTKNEVEKYLQGRYIGPSEAIWRLFEFKIHEEDPTVITLPVHLPNHQPVCFNPNASREEIQMILDTKKSKLMEWFDYNAHHDDGHIYTYDQFPQHYVVDPLSKKWKIRQHGFAIGRMNYCTPTSGERYYLPPSFAYLSLFSKNCLLRKKDHERTTIFKNTTSSTKVQRPSRPRSTDKTSREIKEHNLEIIRSSCCHFVDFT
jgi:hypothetical protein